MILNSGYFLKIPLGNDDRLLEAVTKIESDVIDKDWNKATEDIRYSEDAWAKIVKRIQFSLEKEYIIEITGTLSRIKGGIEARDNKALMEEIYYFYGLWDKLAK